MKPPDLSRMPVFVLVARVKIGSLSLPFTGQPFVEASTATYWPDWSTGRCPSPGSPSLRRRDGHRRHRCGTRRCPSPGSPSLRPVGSPAPVTLPNRSLPFTGQPFVEAPTRSRVGSALSCRCPSPGSPSLRHAATGAADRGVGGRCPSPGSPSLRHRRRRGHRPGAGVAALHRAALR